MRAYELEFLILFEMFRCLLRLRFETAVVLDWLTVGIIAPLALNI
jgi:hypothetical protein